MKVQTLTADDSISLPYARYRVQQKVESTSIIYSSRDFIMAAGLVMPEKYPDVKDFFDKIQVDDDGAAVMERFRVSPRQTNLVAVSLPPSCRMLGSRNNDPLESKL